MLLAPWLLLVLSANPGWPLSDPQTPAEQLLLPQNRPDDPRFAPGERCDGQLGLLSATPECLPNLVSEERAAGPGAQVDRAWLWTTGRPEVALALIDSGVNWSDPELITRYRLNPGELPAPVTSSLAPALVHDRNQDGLFNVQDFTSATGTVAPTTAHVLDPRLRARPDLGDANQNGLLDPQDLILIFSDGEDGDQNGRVDDICGWDVLENDNDPQGTATSTLASAAVATANNGLGGAGACPGCSAIPIRAGEGGFASYLAIAEALRFAVRAGARAAATDLHSMGSGPALLSALDATRTAGILVVATAGVGNASGLAGTPGRAIAWDPDRVLIVGAVSLDDDPQEATSARSSPRCAGYGSQLALVAPDRPDCTGRSAGIAAGVAGLVLSAALGLPEQNIPPLKTPLSAGALRQLLISSATELAELRPQARSGSGRLDARAAIDALLQRRLPLEVRFLSPRWYAMVNPDAPGGVSITGELFNTSEVSATWQLGFAAGQNPAPQDFTTIERGSLSPGEQSEFAAALRRPSLFSDPTASPDQAGRFAVTLQLEVNAGEDSQLTTARRTIFVHRDLELLPAFPVDLQAPIIGSPRVADIDEDAQPELIVATTDGLLHVVNAEGAAKESWPRDLEEPLLSAPSIAGGNIAVLGALGTLWVLNATGVSPGFPVSLNPDRGAPLGATASPVLFDINNDDRDDVIVVGADGRVFAFDLNSGTLPGFPVVLGEPAGAPAVGDIDQDGRAEIVLQTKDRLFVFGPDGRPKPGFPVLLTPEAQPRLLPSAPVLADLDGDRRLEIVAAQPGGALSVWSAQGEQTLIARAAFDAGGPEYRAAGAHPVIAPIGPGGTLELLHSVFANDAEGLGRWSADGAWIPGFPKSAVALSPVGPAIADIDGDRRAEVLFGNGAHRLLAIGPTAKAPRLWPKLTGGVMLGAPALGDLDQDGMLDVVAGTQEGLLFVWRTAGSASLAPAWQGYRHDNRATGNLRTPTAVLTPRFESEGCGCTSGTPKRAAGLLERFSGPPALFGLLGLFWLFAALARPLEGIQACAPPRLRRPARPCDCKPKPEASSRATERPLNGV